MSYTAMELAQAFIKTGELEDAIEALNTHLDEHAGDDAARRLRIQVLLRLGEPAQLQRALADWNELIQPTAADQIDLSVLHQRLGNLDAAIAAVQVAHSAAPTDERVAERLLDLFIKAERFEDAVALIRQQERSWRWLEREGDVLVAMGDDVLATARYGLVLAQLEDLTGTLRADYLQALRVRVLMARAHAYRRLGQIETAREHYQAAQAILPDDPTIGFNLGLLTAIDGEREKAVTQCRSAFAQASPVLQAEMRRSLAEDAAFEGLLGDL